MLVCKCDRCGKINEENYKPFARIKIELTQDLYSDIDFDLCEQCYQTIKEVLEDGEIK